MNYRKNQQVVDRITSLPAYIISATKTNLDGRLVSVYLLDTTIPTSPNYPDRWRHEGELQRK